MTPGRLPAGRLTAATITQQYGLGTEMIIWGGGAYGVKHWREIQPNYRHLDIYQYHERSERPI